MKTSGKHQAMTKRKSWLAGLKPIRVDAYQTLAIKGAIGSFRGNEAWSAGSKAEIVGWVMGTAQEAYLAHFCHVQEHVPSSIPGGPGYL